MQQFKVPQYIELEDKIIGPLTLKQFLYLLAGAIILFILWFFLKLGLFIVIAIPVIAVATAFAFYKPHGRPLINLIFSFFNYIRKPRLYLWRRKND